MIRSIELTGFQSHRKTRLDFVPGVNVLVGETNSGKTSVLRGLKWVVDNRPLGDSYVSRKYGETCSVTVTTDRGVITRERAKRFNGYRITLDGKEYEFKDIKGSVPEELVQVLDLRDINVQTQFDSVFLFNLSPGQVSRYVSEQLGLDAPDAAVSAAKSATSAASQEATRLENELRSAEERAGRLDYVDGLLPMVSELEGWLENVHTFQSQIDMLTEAADTTVACRRAVKRMQAHLEVISIDDVTEMMAEIRQLQEQKRDIESAVSTLLSAQRGLEEARAAHEGLGKQVDEARREYVDALTAMGVCPTCGSDVDPDLVEHAITGA